LKLALEGHFTDHHRFLVEHLLAMALHHMIHFGQLADARRAAGRSPFI
jgi:hypothetical protein